MWQINMDLLLSKKIHGQNPAPGFVYAPVAAGQDAGFAQIYLNNQWIGNVPLVFGRTVEQKSQPEPNLWERLLGGSNT